MMQIENLDNDIVRQLENNGLKKGDREQPVKLLLTYTYMAVKMYWSMSPEDRVLASDWHKTFSSCVSVSDVTPCIINDDCLHCCPSVRQQFTVLA